MTTSQDTRRPRGAARREALLEAVLSIVAEVGTEGVTHRRVAERAQLPLASTTYWFDSKEQLLIAALELAAERDVARLHALAARHVDGEDAAATPDAPDPPDAPDTERAHAIEAVLCAVLDPLDEPTSRASLMASYALLLEAARRPALQTLSRRWTDAYLDTVGALMHLAGSARPREDARLVLATADGLLLEQLAAGDAEDLRPGLRRVAVALLAAS